MLTLNMISSGRVSLVIIFRLNICADICTELSRRTRKHLVFMYSAATDRALSSM